MKTRVYLFVYASSRKRNIAYPARGLIQTWLLNLRICSTTLGHCRVGRACSTRGEGNWERWEKRMMLQFVYTLTLTWGRVAQSLITGQCDEVFHATEIMIHSEWLFPNLPVVLLSYPEVFKNFIIIWWTREMGCNTAQMSTVTSNNCIISIPADLKFSRIYRCL
jgi:hypothetical protein